MPPSVPSEEELFFHAVALPAKERAAYLAQACGGDRDLRARVESLLRAHDQARHFLEPPPGLGSDETAIRQTPRSEEKPHEQIGRYRLLEKFGEGGCGVVYLAEQTEPMVRRVALKVIKLGMDTKEVIARFEAERQALALMDHPNIAKVLDAGATDAGRPFFVMELVRGVLITKYCDERNLGIAARLRLFTQVCHAIHHAHQKGVIHRDIKPSNILVTLNDAVPVPKVIDFGIAKATAGRLTNQTLFTAVDQFIGTPAYMSPEQAEMSSLDIDTRSDIYSLGVLLYELLTGRTPFDTTELLKAGLDTMRRHIREVDPQRPSTRLSTLPGEALNATAKLRQLAPLKLIHLLHGDLDWIVMKALEKNRARRYETAKALADDVTRHLNNQPITARPPSLAYRLAKLVRRNKLAFGAAAALAVALVVGLSVFAEFAAHGAFRPPGGSTVRARPPGQSVAVLPFANLSAEKDDSLSDGITEEILSTLAKVPGLRVPARSSSFLFKERKEDPRRIGELLQVGALLEGTVRKAGSRLRVTADLIDTSTGFRLWTETYDREMTNIFAIQDDIARAIVTKLQASMTETVALPINRRRTHNIEAYEWYLKGVFHLEMLSESGFASAIGCFQQVQARQPDYAPAYSGLAQAYFWQRYFAYVPPGEVLPQLRRTVAKALELDAQLADAWLSEATLKFYVDRDWAAAERAFQRALALDPGYVHARCFYALFLAAMRRQAEARIEARRTQELDPLSLPTKVVAGWVHYYNGDFESAVELAGQAAKAAADFHMAHWLVADALFRQGKRAEGLAMIEKARGIAAVTDVLADLGWMYGRVGRTTEARQILDELKALGRQRFVPAYSMANVYDGIGDLEQTDSWMRKAIDDREAMVVMINASADEITRAHPQFREWVRRLGLAQSIPTTPNRK